MGDVDQERKIRRLEREVKALKDQNYQTLAERLVAQQQLEAGRATREMWAADNARLQKERDQANETVRLMSHRIQGSYTP